MKTPRGVTELVVLQISHMAHPFCLNIRGAINCRTAEGPASGRLLVIEVKHRLARGPYKVARGGLQ